MGQQFTENVRTWKFERDKIDANFTELYTGKSDSEIAVSGLQTALNGKVDDSQVLTDVPVGAIFTDTDTITTVNGKTGIITKADIVALGIPSQDNDTIYSHPLTHAPSIILQDVNNRFVTDVEKVGYEEGHFHSSTPHAPSDANNYVHPANHAISVISGLQLALDGKIDDSQVLTNVPVGALFTDTITTINSKSGIITKADIVALGIPAQDTDTIYVHPANHAISIITGLQSALDGKVDDSQVLTNVPVSALFTDTIYTHPASHAISVITGLQGALDGKVDDSQVLTNVPLSALFTDTIYTHPANHAISVITGLQTALDGKIDDAQVLTNVPVGALFTDNNTITSINGKTGVIAKADIVALGIPAQDTDTIYVHPDNHPISVVTGLQTALDGSAKFKYVADAVFTAGGTTFTVTDAFITTSTQIVIGLVGIPNGKWSWESFAGYFTIVSTDTETATVTFDWGATK